MAAKHYRVAVIGSTGRGNYGHGLDTVWLEIPEARIVAVADDNAEGLAAAVKRLGGPSGFADYRNMLAEVKPDIVSVSPRWLDQHRDMVVAAAESGSVRGIYLEKPMCRSLAEADAMIAACEMHAVKLVISYQTRYSPKLSHVRQLIDEGKIGRVLELRGRGKEDQRGGGEDLWVLGAHVMNLMHHFGGDPRWCMGSVYEDGTPVDRSHVADGKEGIGPLAGDLVRAVYGFDRGVTGYFASTRNAKGTPSRFGLTIHGSEGVIKIATGYLPAAFWLPDPSWSPGQTGKKWVPISSEGPGKPELLKDGGLHAGNILLCRDLMAAIEDDRQPEASIYEALTSMEMIVGVFESHRLQAPAHFPLKNRQNPLTMLPA